MGAGAARRCRPRIGRRQTAGWRLRAASSPPANGSAPPRQPITARGRSPPRGCAPRPSQGRVTAAADWPRRFGSLRLLPEEPASSYWLPDRAARAAAPLRHWPAAWLRAGSAAPDWLRAATAVPGAASPLAPSTLGCFRDGEGRGGLRGARRPLRLPIHSRRLRPLRSVRQRRA